MYFFYKLHCSVLYGVWADIFVEYDVLCTVLFVVRGIVGRNIALLIMMSHDVVNVNTLLARESC
jgi:hypothetical protein